jgi:hypothetical protein
MQFLQPSYLWGLVALAIPIAIHLWSRKKVRTIKVGSILFIPETKSNQSNSIQLNEWLLLVMRCLIIGLLVSILAQPQLTKNGIQQEVAYVFEPSLLATQDGMNRFAQIPREGRRLLQTGFPEWEQGDVINLEEFPNYWQLAQEMDQIPADSVVVFTNAFAKALKGKRPTLSTKINWIVIDTESTGIEPLFARTVKDSAEIISVRSETSVLGLEKKLLSSNNVAYTLARDSVSFETAKGKLQVPVLARKPLNISLVYDTNYNAERIYFEAAFRAIEMYTNQELLLNVKAYEEGISLDGMDRLIWLSDGQRVKSETPTLALAPDDLADRLIRDSRFQNISFLTQRLIPEVLGKERFVGELLRWLELDKEIETKIKRLDKRVVSQYQLETNYIKKSNQQTRVQMADLSSALWILLVVLLIGERIVAKIRKQ